MRDISPREQIIYDRLVEVADRDEVCPTNLVLADLLGLASEESSSTTVRALERRGMIAVRRTSHARVVTISATGKRTAEPPPHNFNRSNGGNTAASVERVQECRFKEGELARRILRDQAALRAQREHWLDVEQQKYGLARRGRLVDEMPL